MPTRATLQSMGLFVLLLAGLETAYALAFQSAPLVALAQVTAQSTGWILALLGQAPRIEGTIIYTPQFNMRIAAECTAVTPMIVFTAATLALPSPLAAKLKGLLVGAVALYLVNLLRIASLYALGVAAPDLVEFTHLVVWQAALVIFAIGLWLAWAGGVRAPRSA